MLIFMILSWFFGGQLEAAPLRQAQPWLGIMVDEQAKDGVLIKTVIENTPAAKAGLQTGDLITAIDKTGVTARTQLLEVLREKGIGNSVVVHFKRGKSKLEKQLQLEALPDTLGLVQKQLLDRPAPAFSLVGVKDKKSIRSQDLLGKVSIIEFWATWCPACRAAIPRLNQWAKEHKAITLISVSDENEEVLLKFIKNEPSSYIVARDSEGSMQAKYPIPSIPSFILIDKKGVIRQISLGGGIYLEALLKEAEKLAQEA